MPNHQLLHGDGNGKSLQKAMALILGNVREKLVDRSTPVRWRSIVLPTFAGGVFSFFG